MAEAYEMNEDEQALMDELLKGDEDETVQNPFTGESVVLCPEAAALHDFIKGAEIFGHTDFDMARDLFLKRWPDEYYKLIELT